jgi:aspartate/methionine/tyrosine aminotransferase
MRLNFTVSGWQLQHILRLATALFFKFSEQLCVSVVTCWSKVCVSPGVGFGEYGDDHVRFALIENQDRIRQAVRGIRSMFRADGLITQKA